MNFTNITFIYTGTIIANIIGYKYLNFSFWILFIEFIVTIIYFKNLHHFCKNCGYYINNITKELLSSQSYTSFEKVNTRSRTIKHPTTGWISRHNTYKTIPVQRVKTIYRYLYHCTNCKYDWYIDKE
jgi:hypothetical protein